MLIYRVRRELEKRKLNPLRQLFSFANLKENIFGQTYYVVFVFIVLFYTVQCLFQFDVVCTVLYDNDVDEDDFDDIETDYSSETQLKQCRSRLVNYFNSWDEHEQTMTRIITFLLGFYVSMIGRRWWDQVLLSIVIL